MPISYGEACSLLSDNPAPVVFIDTCVLLDLVRAPIRESLSAETSNHARDMRARVATTHRTMWLITSETVQTEWNENIENIKAEVEQEISKLESKRRHFMSAAQAATNSLYQYGQSETALNLVSHLELSSRAMLDASLVIAPDDIHLVRAMNRVKGYQPPAQRGKAEPKDCEIFELFLALCKASRSEGRTEKFVFVSSNTKDYGGDSSGGIQLELDSVGAVFTHNLPWALAVIDGRA